MSGSAEETRDQKEARSTLASLLNNVALPNEKREMDQATNSANRAGYAQTPVDNLTATEHAVDEQGINGQGTHADRNGGQSSAHGHNQVDAQHRGAAMNIWGEAKEGDSARVRGAATQEAASARVQSTTSPSAPWGGRQDSEERDDAISIKGRADGVSIEVGRGSWSELMEQLTQRLGAASGFFRGGKVTLNVGIRPLQDSELLQVRDLLERFGMALGVVRSSSEQTCQAALAQGLAANLDAVDGIQAQAALTNHDTLLHFVYRGNLRSGQILKRSETVLVLGDVNPGAQVVSDGDILIWGRLRGIAHAGYAGDVNSIISALSMEPTQLRIANLIAVLPEEESSSWMGKLVSGREMSKRPEIAYIADEQIVLDPWDQSKPGGVMAYRR